MLHTKYKGYKHERKFSGCLQKFDHVTTVHESLGGLEHMERPPTSFERKLDPATLGIQWPTGSGQVSQNVRKDGDSWAF